MYASSVNMGCLRTVDSKTGNDDASCKDTREIERGRESKQNASAESTVTTVLCLHYYHSEESQ